MPRNFLLRVLSAFLMTIPIINGAFSQTIITVTGIVKDKMDKPIPGVSVVIQNKSTTGTTTNNEGEFKLQVSTTDVLVFTHTGYIEMIRPVNNSLVLEVIMEAKAGSLEDVIVTSYGGKQKKISVVGAQSTISAKELQHPVANLSTMLAGRVAGVVGVQRSGLPGSNSADIWIRGIQTFGGSPSGALVIIDGVQGRDLNSVDPEDIESFTILKDASSTAVYGSLGANGVILINTKKGKAGKVKLMLNYNHGTTSFTKVPEMADAKTYMELKNEALVASGQAPQFTQAYIDSTLSGTANPYRFPNVNWMDLLFKKYSFNKRLNVSATGGNENTKYYTSVAYYDETSLLKTDPKVDYDATTLFRRFNYTSNIDMNLTKTTKFSLYINGYITNFVEPGGGAGQAFAQAQNASPVFYPPMYPGNLVSGIGYGSTPSPNPWAAVTQTGYIKRFTSKINSGLFLTQDLDFITKGLSARGMYSYDLYNESFERRIRNRSIYYLNQANPYKPDGTLNLEQMIAGSDELGFATSNGGTRQFTMEGQVSYDRYFGDHHIYSTVVYNQLSQLFPFNGTLSTYIPFRQQNVAGKVTYSYNDKYFTEITAGYNGSENYAPANRFGFFPSIGVGWVVSKEKFFEPLANIFQYFKIRYSNGIAGAPGTGLRFGFLTLVTNNARGITFGRPGASMGVTGVNISQYGADVKWATAHTQDLGLEFNVLNNKLSFVLDYFRSHRTGVFLTRADFPDYAGLQYNPVGNYGVLDAAGFDGTVELQGISLSKKVSISFRGNFTYNTDILRENRQAPFANPYQERRGHNLLASYGYIAERIFQSQKEIDNSPSQIALGNPRVGDLKYKDLNGDGVIDIYDQTKISRWDVPNFVYGFGANMNVGRFYLSVFFQGISGASRLMSGNAAMPFSGGGNDGNIFMISTNRWTQENKAEHPYFPRLGWGNAATSNNTVASTWWVKDMSFIRLKTVDLGYNIPKEPFKKIGLASARVYFSGVNLLYWSKFKLWDPELNTSNGNTYPNTRNMSIGLQVNF
ncbi:SusC/RagA family TonB-linked outer membrane protein [Niastella caeni]|nr:TonB-dependent receptor [Niastella caeni]